MGPQFNHSVDIDLDVSIAYVLVAVFVACAFVSACVIGVIVHVREGELEEMEQMEQRTWLVDMESANGAEDERLPRYSTIDQEGPPRYRDEPPPGYEDGC